MSTRLRTSHRAPTICKCSTTGPSGSAGMKVSAPTINTVPIKRPTNSGAWVGRLPTPDGTIFFAAKLPAIANTGTASQ